MAVGKLKEFFGGSQTEQETVATELADNAPPRESQTVSSSSSSPPSSSAETSPTPSADSVTEKKKEVPKKVDTIPLKIVTRFPVNPPMTVDEKKKARGR